MLSRENDVAMEIFRVAGRNNKDEEGLLGTNNQQQIKAIKYHHTTAAALDDKQQQRDENTNDNHLNNPIFSVSAFSVLFLVFVLLLHIWNKYSYLAHLREDEEEEEYEAVESDEKYHHHLEDDDESEVEFVSMESGGSRGSIPTTPISPFSFNFQVPQPPPQALTSTTSSSSPDPVSNSSLINNNNNNSINNNNNNNTKQTDFMFYLHNDQPPSVIDLPQVQKIRSPSENKENTAPNSPLVASANYKQGNYFRFPEVDIWPPGAKINQDQLPTTTGSSAQHSNDTLTHHLDILSPPEVPDVPKNSPTMRRARLKSISLDSESARVVEEHLNVGMEDLCLQSPDMFPNPRNKHQLKIDLNAEEFNIVESSCDSR